MSRVENFVIDRVVDTLLLNSDDELLGYLDQLSNATIDVTSESKEAKDAQGVLIKRFFTGKTATFEATNTLLNLSLLGVNFGDGSITEATASNIVNMPDHVIVKRGDAPKLKNPVSGSVHVYGLTPSGGKSKEYGSATNAATDKFAMASDGTITLPTNTDESQYLIYYKKAAKSGEKYLNSAKTFPTSCVLRAFVLGCDVCKPDDPRYLCVEFPNFQISPDINIQLQTEQELTFKGDAAVSYCDIEKPLFVIYALDDEDLESEDDGD